MRTATGPGAKITRLTLFPPSGNKIVMQVQDHKYDEGILSFTDLDGIHYETTLVFAIEHIREGHQKAPFSK